jgi:hypothetical protein
MRERAHLAGGWLTAGPDGEQFRVTVFIPYGPRVLPQPGGEVVATGVAAKPADKIADEIVERESALHG